MKRVKLSRNRDLRPGLDYIANFINSVDTEGMTALQVRSLIYKECMSK